jgi:ElaA protein
MKYYWLPFAELSPKQVYDILQLREHIIHVEHGAKLCDVDEIDFHAKHLLGYDGEKLISYLRVYLHHDCLYIDRLLVMPSYRSCGLGRLMMTKTLGTLQTSYPDLPIGVWGWSGALGFYKKLNFNIPLKRTLVCQGYELFEMRYQPVSASCAA